jgi:hypothetical protein
MQEELGVEEIDCPTLASYHIPPFIYCADAEEPFEKRADITVGVVHNVLLILLILRTLLIFSGHKSRVSEISPLESRAYVCQHSRMY